MKILLLFLSLLLTSCDLLTVKGNKDTCFQAKEGSNAIYYIDHQSTKKWVTGRLVQGIGDKKLTISIFDGVYKEVPCP